MADQLGAPYLMFPGILSENSRKPAVALWVSARSFVEVNLTEGCRRKTPSSNPTHDETQALPSQQYPGTKSSGLIDLRTSRSILSARSAKMIRFANEERN